VAYVIYAFSNPRGGAIVTLVWGMWVVSALLDISWLYFGVQEFKMPTIRSIVTKLISMFVIFAFVTTQDDLWIYCAAIAGSFLANQLLLWPFLHRYVDFQRPTFSGMCRHIVPNLRLFIPVIAISFYVTLDKIMLGLLTNMQQVGFFEYSEKLSRMPMALITAMGTVMLPRMTAELSCGHRDEALSLLESSIWAMLVMAFAMMFGILGVAHDFAPIFLGEEFANCDVLMCILALIIPVVSTTNVLGRQYLLPVNRDGLFTKSVCVGAAVNICANAVLIPLFASLGAAIATVLAEISVMLVQFAMTRRELPLFQYAKNAFPYAVMGAVMMLLIWFISRLLFGIWGQCALQLIVEILVGAIFYILMALGWCLVKKDPHLMPFLSGVASKFGCELPAKVK
jgi:O-antigen/teichoic acid export membrane protein